MWQAASCLFFLIDPAVWESQWFGQNPFNWIASGGKKQKTNNEFQQNATVISSFPQDNFKSSHDMQ